MTIIMLENMHEGEDGALFKRIAPICLKTALSVIVINIVKKRLNNKYMCI